MSDRLNIHTIVMLAGLLLCFYFSYHLLHGQRSLIALVQTQELIGVHQSELNTISAKRSAAEVKVKMMRPGSIDRDLLEERIHFVLGYASKDDLVITLH